MTIEADEPAGPVDHDPPRRSIGQNVGALVTSQLFTWVLSTIWVWIVPRYLGAEAFGELSVAGSIWAMAIVFAMFGSSMMTTVEIAKDQRGARSLVSRVIRYRLTGWVLVVPVVAAVLILGPYSRTTIAVASRFSVPLSIY